MTEYSREIIIETAPGADLPSRTLRLVEITAGRVATDGGTRWQEHRWAVRFDEDGTVRGRQFRSLADARRNFENSIAPSEEAATITLAALDEAFDEDCDSS